MKHANRPALGHVSVAAAKRRCPQAVYIALHFDLYREVSQQIHAVFAQYTDLIEPLSLDEAIWT